MKKPTVILCCCRAWYRKACIGTFADGLAVGTKQNILVHPRCQEMPLFRQPNSAQSGSRGLIASGSVCKEEGWGTRGST